MAREQDERRHERRDEADHQREGDVAPEHGAEQERQLHVAHAEALSGSERGGEQESRRAERAEQPLDARVDRRVRDEDDRRGREHDPVRHEPIAEIGGGECDEDDHEERGEGRIRRRAEDEHAGDDERSGNRLDGRVERRDAGPTVPAVTSQQQVGDDRDVVTSLDLGAAVRAARARLGDGDPQRHPSRNDVDEAAEGKSRGQRKSCERKVHTRVIGIRSAAVEQGRTLFGLLLSRRGAL